MDKEAIKRLLPHRDAMLLIDEAELTETGARGKYTMRGDEWFFSGHFPGDPVTPGVILCEILAQSACVLIGGTPDGKKPFFTGLNNVRFRTPVRPGDIFETECALVKSKPPFYFVSGKGTVNGKLCVKAEFSFALVEE